jgi:uncharacterized iron-regulated membrane protein
MADVRPVTLLGFGDDSVRLSRQLWVLVHRWAGLTIAVFLAISGLTGAMLAFTDELEPLLLPQVFRAAPPVPGAVPLDPFDLRDRVLARYPDGLITQMPLRADPDRSLRFNIQRLEPQTGMTVPYAESWDEIFVNPYDGSVTGRRRWGDIGQGAINLLPFVHHLHDSLTMDDWGRLTLGIAAMIWTLDCFVGFYLTLPVRSTPRHNGRRWLHRWRSSWKLRWRQSSYKRTFDLHRAGGLWLWPMLLVFAWSGVSFNLPQVYDPVMRQIGYLPIAEGIVPPVDGTGGPGVDLRAAARQGQSLARAVARRSGIAIDEGGPASINYYPQIGVYLFRFTSSASVARANYGDSLVIFSARTGGLLKSALPRQEAKGGALHAWLEALHLAAIGGLPYKFAVACAGLLITSLSVTGTMIWMKKRTARLRTLRRLNKMSEITRGAG